MTVTKPKVWILQAIYPAIIDTALDVFERQPGVHPALLKLDNVLLSPHVAGATPDAPHAMTALTVDNVQSMSG